MLVTLLNFLSKCGTSSHYWALWLTSRLLAAWDRVSVVPQAAGPLGEALRDAGSLLGQSEWQDLIFVSYSPQSVQVWHLKSLLGSLAHFSAPGGLELGGCSEASSRPSWGGPEGGWEPVGAV